VAVRVSLGFLALTGLVVGTWALVFPLEFFWAFPGFGRAWVSVDGPYNEHLVRDIGALNLGSAVLAFLGLFRPALASPVTVGAATLAYNLPHFGYHVATLGAYQMLDQFGMVFSLGLALGASMVLLLAGRR
jgi:hypothetical protein